MLTVTSVVLAGPPPPEHLIEFPAVHDVLAKVQGTDAVETAVKQQATLRALELALTTLSGELSEEERQLAESYRHERLEASKLVRLEIGSASTNRPARSSLDLDALTPWPRLQARVKAQLASEDAAPSPAPTKQTNIAQGAIGLMLVVGVVVIVLLTLRRNARGT